MNRKPLEINYETRISAAIRPRRVEGACLEFLEFPLLSGIQNAPTDRRFQPWDFDPKPMHREK